MKAVENHPYRYSFQRQPNICSNCYSSFSIYWLGIFHKSTSPIPPKNTEISSKHTTPKHKISMLSLSTRPTTGILSIWHFDAAEIDPIFHVRHVSSCSVLHPLCDWGRGRRGAAALLMNPKQPRSEWVVSPAAAVATTPTIILLTRGLKMNHP